MKHPPYHLRVNKAVDRFMLVDILRILSTRLSDYRGHKYFGLGGPFLEDFRLLGEHFKDLPLVSLESSKHTHLRQKFHRCAKNISLREESVQTFLHSASWANPGIYWLDYTDLSPSRMQEFETLLDYVREDSIVKITVRASNDGLPDRALPAEYGVSEEQLEKWRTQCLVTFNDKYDTLIPAGTDYEQLRDRNFPRLLQAMFRIAAQRALVAGSGRVFQILHSCFYSDNTQMYSLTGVVCRDEEAAKYGKLLSPWPFRNVRWDDPKRIDMPVLSVKERMILERVLPAKKTTGKALKKTLGYNIDETESVSIRKLQQYAMFYRYYPQFARVTAF